MDSDGLLGTAVGLIGLGIVLGAVKKITGKGIDDDLVVNKSKSKSGEIW